MASEIEQLKSHLFFAKNTLIFCQPETRSLILLRCILACFQAVSGLKINLHKSELVILGAGDDDMGYLNATLNCRSSNLPINYLGAPLGAKHNDSKKWDPVIGMVQNRLATWKKKFLSKGGRLTLIKSTLSNLPIYYLLVLNLATKVAKKLETIQCNFLWSDVDNENKKYHLVNWKEVKKSVWDGDLGLRTLAKLNKALIGKWIWRCWNEPEGLWKKIIDCKWSVDDQRSLSHIKNINMAQVSGGTS